MGVHDFAGGIVVHASAGFAALAAVFYVGKKCLEEKVLIAFHLLPSVQACYGSDGSASTPAMLSPPTAWQ